jgi:hypothetical protein
MLSQNINTIIQQFEPISLLEMDRVKLMNRVDTKFAFSIKEFIDFLPNLIESYKVLEINGNRIPSYESLYYDNDHLGFFEDHHNGRMNRFKVRYRKYIESDLIFLEVKHKFKGRTDKSRIQVAEIPLELVNEHAEFVKNLTEKEDVLTPVLWNSFHRITLVNKIENERLTLDFDLKFNWEDRSQYYNNMIIAELKQEKFNRNSAFFRLMKVKIIRPYRLSKYCIGSIDLYGHKKIKYNRFKKKLIQLKKINNDVS